MNFGIMVRHDFGEANLTFFSIGWHSHHPDDHTPCPLRAGLMLGFMGLHVAFGLIDG